MTEEVTDASDLEDFIEEAISDSFDVDWNARAGAKAVLGALAHQGLNIVANSPMTEEVTDAITCDWRCVQCKFVYFDSVRPDKCDCGCGIFAMIAWKEPNMRSASNSPTTNGEVSEPRQTHCADPDCTGPKPHVAEAAGCKWGNPRAASDDEVERLQEALVKCRILFSEIRNDWSDPRAECRQGWAIIDAALSTPTKASAVDDPETAKGGE